MKKTDLISLRTKTNDELAKLLLEKRKELDKTAVKIAGGTEKNLKKAMLLRKEVAKILTIAREKDLIEKENKEEVTKK